MPDYLAQADQEIVNAVMIEHPEAVRNAEQIVSVPGVLVVRLAFWHAVSRVDGAEGSSAGAQAVLVSTAAKTVRRVSRRVMRHSILPPRP